MERVGLVKAGKGEFAKAGEIADLMVHPDFVYSGIAVSQAAGGDEAAADETLGRIAFPAAIVLALQQIAEAKIKAGETDAALEILARAVTSADDIEHDEERIRSLCDTGNQYLEAARPDLAIETFIAARGLAERLDNLHRDFFLVNCALGCLYAGNSDLADETLDLVSDKTQLASALLAVARESWKAGEKDAAIETLDESVAILISQSDRQIRDSRARNALHASIAAQFAGFGKTDRGVEIALENPDIAEKTAALSQIARILTVQKEDAITRQTINLIDEDSDRLLALISVSDEKEKLGEREAAISLLDEAADLSETVPQLAARSGVLNEIAVRYLGHGLHEKGRASAIENLAVIADIRDGSRRAVSLANLSDIYCEGGLEISEQEKRFLQQFVRLAES
jgi:tetratricopeptide (TPR) repeat protein